MSDEKENQSEPQQLKIDGVMHRFFAEEDLDCCWKYHKSYLIGILNGTYELEEARSDLAGLIGSEWDKRNTSE